jgi:hypothetical protein
MNPTICIATNGTLRWPKAGGFLWVFLNWALGLRAVGCRVIWLERITADICADEVPKRILNLRTSLEAYGLENCLALFWETEPPAPGDVFEGCLTFEEAREADLLLNLAYDVPFVGLFRRSALVDIDPGLTQIWIDANGMKISPHDTYFTIGETVGEPEALFPDCGLRWHYTPPPVHLPVWPQSPAAATAAFTTITNWWGREWVEYQGESYDNRKRVGFLPFLDLPRRANKPLELAVCLGEDSTEDRVMLHQHGWRVEDAWDVTSTPWDYQRYIQDSFGEFSCVKPSCVRLQNAWISDRSLCYLASGKPVVVQHTGPSRFLPDRGGVFRFQDFEEAAQCLEAVATDYDRQCRLARNLSEEHFNAKTVISRVLEKALS